MAPSSHVPAAGSVLDPAGVPPRPARRLLASPVVLVTAGALVLALLVEAAPVVGGDLVAQQWWASWAPTARTPVDLGWFGGVPVVSYSLLSPELAALLGLPLLGILGTVVGTAATTALLGRLDVPAGRLTAAGLVAAVTWAADQWSGRTTFGAGAALGCLALVVAGRSRGRATGVGSAGLAVLAGAVSPVASLFLLLAAAAWWYGAGRGGRPWSARLRSGPRPAVWLAAGAVLPLLAARLLGAVGGPQPASTHQMVAALAATGLTWSLLPRGRRVLRGGVVLTAALLLVTWLIPDPVGSNSVRLVLLFAAPVLVAVARTEPLVTGLAALAVLWAVPPLLEADFVPRDMTPASAQAAALVRELENLGPVGRVEVVPLKSHEESLWVARQVPLARGWLRQLDTSRGALFYDGSLDAAGYRRWLRGAGASYVALPVGRLDYRSWDEAALLRAGVPGVEQIWADRSWRLYSVAGGGLLHGNGVLVSSDRSQIVVDVSAPGRLDVALWWSRWTSVDGPGGCVRAGRQPGWTTLTVRHPGRFVLTSHWRPVGRCG